jgi:putative ABC transport system permease protein
MSVLTLKTVRDLWRAKWQYLAVGAMVLLGVAFFNASYAAYENLRNSYDTSYRQLNFEDFGITFYSAPERVVERVRDIAGVRDVEGRLVEDVIVEIPGRITKKLVGRLISVPADRIPKVNAVHIVIGRNLVAGTAREVLLEASFAKHHSLEPGDAIEAVRGTGRVKFKIVGIVQSAEYLYVVRSKQELMPSPDTFGVMFVSDEVLGSLVGRRGKVNEVRVTVDQPRRLDSIMRQAKASLSVYRPNDPVPRKDQPSSQMLEQDVQGFQAYAVLFPAFFLSVAALTVYTLLMRMVHLQRPIIGLLRSLGYSRVAVVRHYMAAAFIVGIAFSMLGTVVGYLMASWTSTGYMSQLQVPYEVIAPRYGVFGIGIAIGTLVCVIAGFFPARIAAGIRPAEAMRPVSPSSGARWSRIDRIFPGLSLLERIPVRNVFRQPRRTLSTLFGIVAGLALMITAAGLLDSTQVAIDDLLTGSFRYDLRVDFIRQRSHADVARVRSWPGVLWAEGNLSLPVRMRHAGKSYDALVTGIEPGTKLTELKSSDGSPIQITGNGAVFAQTLRKRLDLEVGDTVELALPEELTKEDSSIRLIRVAGFNEEAMGTQAYAPIDTVQKLFRNDLELPPNAISGVTVKCEPRYLDQTRKRLLAMTDAASVISVPEMRTTINDMLKTIQKFIWIMELFGAALAFAMIFNMVTINVLEREPEVATLRTIGVSRWQIARSIIVENMVVALIGVIVGLPLARLFVEGFWQAAQTEQQQELFTFSVVIAPATYGFGVAAILLVTLVSLIPSLKYVGKIDLAKATKERST